MKKRRNILFITCDQLRADCLGCYGDETVRTPNIDALAARGVRFTQLFTAYPACAPNRASLATGRYPSVNGVRGNGFCLPKNEVTLMESLRQVGYATAGIGKMHFEPQWQLGDTSKGFFDPDPALSVNPQPEPWELPWYGFTETQLSEDHRVGPYADYLRSHGLDPWADPHSYSYPQHQTVRSAYPAKHHQTTWIAERSIDFIEKQTGDRPFFMWISFVAPHHPFCVPAPYDTMYNPEDMPLPVYSEEERALWPTAYRAKHDATEGSHEAIGMASLSDAELQKVRAYYYGSITQIDDQVGRIVKSLEEKNLLDDTIIVFSTDHGEMLGDHHLLFKGTMYDEVTRMPFLIAGPDTKPDVCDGLFSAIDVMPTLLDLVGVDIPGAVQGRSCLTSAARDDVLIEGGGVLRTLRTPSAQISWHGPGEPGELYDLADDPHAQNNLWNDPAAAELKQDLLDRLMRQMALNTDPLPVRMGR